MAFGFNDDKSKFELAEDITDSVTIAPLNSFSNITNKKVKRYGKKIFFTFIINEPTSGNVSADTGVALADITIPSIYEVETATANSMALGNAWATMQANSNRYNGGYVQRSSNNRVFIRIGVKSGVEYGGFSTPIAGYFYIK